jgi:erythromycin esterase
MKPSAKYFLFILIALCSVNSSFAQDTTEMVISWLKQNCIPLKSIEPGDNFSDLQSLKTTLKDVQVVGLGEATHGTKEFFKMTHRLVQFLVTEMGFTAFTLESSYSDSEPINDYIISGKGNLSDVLTGQGYMAWDTEEFSAMLAWLKAYNQLMPEGKKVRFYGIDVVCYQRIAREKVMAYLKNYAPDKTASTDSLFQVLAGEEVKWPTRLDEQVLQNAFIPLHELISYFYDNKNKLISISSFKEWEQATRYSELMEEAIFKVVDSLPESLSSGRQSRDYYMAQNLRYLMKNAGPNAKFMFCAHNDHVVTDSTDSTRSVGFYLRQWLGNKYFALGMHCNGGTFIARELLPDGYWGDLRSDTILSFQKSFAWHLEQTGKGPLFIDLRLASSNHLVDKWLGMPGKVGNGSWRYKNSDETFIIKEFKGLYDGLVFIDRSSPVQPTKNALARSAARIGF